MQDDLQINSIRMRENLEITRGLVMAESLTMVLAPQMGRPEAYQLVQVLCNTVINEGKDLQQVALENAQVRGVLSPQEIERALKAEEYLGSTDVFIERALAAYCSL